MYRPILLQHKSLIEIFLLLLHHLETIKGLIRGLIDVLQTSSSLIQELLIPVFEHLEAKGTCAATL